MADYVVFGATGHVGELVAIRLLEAGKQVRAVARHPDRLKKLAKFGASTMPGSVDDPPFLRMALDGAKAAFVLVPPFFGPGIRAWQDRVANALGDALETTKVPYSVSLSSVGAERASGNGPIAGLHVLETRLDRIPNHSPLHLRPGYFFENNLGVIGLIRAMGLNGGALAPELKLTHIASKDIGDVAARRLLALDWKGQLVQELHGQRDLSMAEVTTVLGKAIGKPELRYVQFPYPDAQQGLVQAGLPAELAALYVEMAKGFNEGIVKPIQPRSAATTTPTSLERWAAEVFAPAFQAS